MFGPAANVFRWLLIASVALIPLGIAAASPLLASRDAMWIVGGMAGVVALALLFLQPVLISGFLPSLHGSRERRWHRWIGTVVVLLVLLHVVGLYVTSPDDIADALFLVSPTPFAVYGVLGLAGVILTACLACVRTRLSRRTWQIVHTILAMAVVIGSIVHALLIDGVMGDTSKLVLCIFLSVATAAAVRKIAVTAASAKKTPASG
jgi:predicted ferric reductase